MKQIRNAIAFGTFETFKREFLKAIAPPATQIDIDNG
jgi:queuine/archaeosine tRNA-ribosyltransferase